MTALREARQLVLDSVPVLASRTVALAEAYGCAAAQSIIAPQDVPSFVNSAMDGFAIRSCDTDASPVRLRVAAAVMAGDQPADQLHSGEAIRIMTGALIPRFADAVVPLENVQLESQEQSILVDRSVPQGTNVRHPGEDIRRGQVVLQAGRLLTPIRMGVLASLGVRRVAVHGTPRVGVLSTGSELARQGSRLRPGQIWDSNRPALLALVKQVGFVPVDLGTAGDTVSEITRALLRGAAGCDAILTSGGVSVGDADLVKPVLYKLSGGSMRWMQVSIKPGKPFAFGTLGEGQIPVFGLAGNPVAAIVGFELLALPALKRMAGYRRVDRPIVPARAAMDIHRRRDGKLHLLRTAVWPGPHGVLQARPLDRQSSHHLLAMAEADGLAMVPDGEGIAEGEAVSILMLGQQPGGDYGSLDTALESL